jgi:hypothetical protein
MFSTGDAAAQELFFSSRQWEFGWLNKFYALKSQQLEQLQFSGFGLEHLSVSV